MYFLGKMCHACAVEKFWGVVQVPLMADFFVILAREQTLYKTCMW
jgi:hypothetical protein